MVREASYLRLQRRGELHQRVEQALALLADCHLCPRDCGVDRLAGKVGTCRTGRQAIVASFHAHFGEEAPLVGSHGSGTIFFSWCNLRCLFCQNYEISQLGEGEAVTPDTLAMMMLVLQKRGCHNINLVSPSHVVPQILEALELAVEYGLTIPLVYNTGGYDALATLALLDGIVDIYMPDMKYADAAIAQELSGIKDYPAHNRAAVKEMYRQVGDLTMDENGVATRGLLVRHLVLPEGLAGTADVVRFLATEVSPRTYLNIMDQYRPCHKAHTRPPLDRPLTRQEYRQAVDLALAAGLTRLDDRRRLAVWLWG
jgi:putative pyruvate formate lyase activating enzyme